MIDVQGKELVEQMLAFARKHPDCPAIRPAVVTFARERIVDVFGDIKPLLQAHWEEIAHYRDIPLNPDYGKYVIAERDGKLRIFTVRKGQELVGYAIYGVTTGIHYSDALIAIQDVLYVKPEHRQGTVGWKLIAFADDQLRAEGVQIVVQHQKIAHPTLGKILQRMGYEQQDVIWTRRLDGI